MRTDEPLSAQQLEDAERTLLQKIGAVWARGWQPRELVRLFRRSPAEAELVLARDRRRSRLPIAFDARPAVGRPDRRHATFPASLPGRVGSRRGTASNRSPEHTFTASLAVLLHTLDVAAPMPDAHPAARRTTRRRIDRQPHDQDERPDAQPGAGTPGAGRVDELRGGGRDVHRQGAGADDPPRDRHGDGRRRVATGRAAGRHPHPDRRAVRPRQVDPA